MPLKSPIQDSFPRFRGSRANRTVILSSNCDCTCSAEYSSSNTHNGRIVDRRARDTIASPTDWSGAFYRYTQGLIRSNKPYS